MPATLVIRDGGLLALDGGLAVAEDPCQCCEPPCGAKAESGGKGVTVNRYRFPSREGKVAFTYNAYQVPDSFLVEGGDEVFVDTGVVSGNKTLYFCKPAGLREIVVTVTGPEGTGWEYEIGCPEGECDENDRNPLP